MVVFRQLDFQKNIFSKNIFEKWENDFSKNEILNFEFFKFTFWRKIFENFRSRKKNHFLIFRKNIFLKIELSKNNHKKFSAVTFEQMDIFLQIQKHMKRIVHSFHFRYWTSQTDHYAKSYPDFSLGWPFNSETLFNYCFSGFWRKIVKLFVMFFGAKRRKKFKAFLLCFFRREAPETSFKHNVYVFSREVRSQF